MTIELHEITIRELVAGYNDAGVDGVTAYGGRLDVRPAYQREFVYKGEKRTAVIDTVMKGYPLNVMYWVERDDGKYEVLDGQQRTICIGQFFSGDFHFNMRYFENFEKEEQDRFLDYKLMVYFCKGNNAEKIEWFRTINIAGEQLSEQELRNAVYHGPWVTDAKKWFSKPACPAEKIASNYMKGSRDRQEYLETAIEWLADGKGPAVNQYMAQHQHDPDASELWTFFQSVITWLEAKFRHTPDRRSVLKGVEWGPLYKKYGTKKLDPAEIEREVERLLADDDVTKKSGIAPFILTGEEKHLSLRQFSETQKRKAYARQKGMCACCGKPFPYEQMHGDHKTAWSKGGRTIDENCQMLCSMCNFAKGAK